MNAPGRAEAIRAALGVAGDYLIHEHELLKAGEQDAAGEPAQGCPPHRAGAEECWFTRGGRYDQQGNESLIVGRRMYASKHFPFRQVCPP